MARSKWSTFPLRNCLRVAYWSALPPLWFRSAPSGPHLSSPGRTCCRRPGCVPTWCARSGTRSAGTDVASAVAAVRSRMDQPSAPGYSSAGTVVAVGEGVTDIRPGDRVACAGAGHAVHAEFACIPRLLLARIPPDSGSQLRSRCCNYGRGRRLAWRANRRRQVGRHCRCDWTWPARTTNGADSQGRRLPRRGDGYRPRTG